MVKNVHDDGLQVACSKLTLPNKRYVCAVADALKFSQEATSKSLKHAGDACELALGRTTEKTA